MTVPEKLEFNYNDSTIITPQEGYSLPEISRTIQLIDSMFTKALGGDYSIMDHALSVAQTTGSLACADIGCGIGRSLSTLVDYVSTEAKISTYAITGYGITLEDYSSYRDAACRVTWQSGGLTQILRDIRRGVKIPDNSISVAWASDSALYWTNPAASLEEVRRFMAPGGRFWFNVERPETGITKPVVTNRFRQYQKIIDGWHKEGIDFRSIGARITAKESGRYTTKEFCVASFPEA